MRGGPPWKLFCATLALIAMDHADARLNDLKGNDITIGEGCT